MHIEQIFILRFPVFRKCGGISFCGGDMVGVESLGQEISMRRFSYLKGFYDFVIRPWL